MIKEISILIVNYNSFDFVDISLYALSKLTKNPYKVFILDNGSNIIDYENLRKVCSNYKNCILERRKTILKGSLAHGTALDYLVKKVDTPYFSILDADAIWLIKNWDEILIRQLNDEVKVIGTQAPVGSSKKQDFPLMFAVLFELESFKRLNISFMPKENSVYHDTGWEVREKYLRAGYKGKVLEMKNTRNFKDGPFKYIICAEYYLEGAPHIFASHFGRGSTLGEHKYRKGFGNIYRFPIIGKYLRMKKGKEEKENWFNICKEVINKQI